jgi:hypothetical protein
LYADDTILFVDYNEEYAKNMKWVLTCFELMSGMRINYHKNELVPIHPTRVEEVESFADIFSCPIGEFSVKYLGIPLHYNKLSREDLQPLVDKIIKRIAGYRGKLLTQVGRLVLIKACIASIPIYLLSFFKFSRWAIDLINSHMPNCFWDDYEGHRKMHLANWHLICIKKYGGLGVTNLKDLNLCLLGSWIRRYIRDESKMWRNIIDRKYCRRDNIFYADSNQASPFWKGILLAA